MEPAYLDKLPSRFRKRFRENLITIGIIVALFIIPPRCGPYGSAAFFTIVWLAYGAYLLARLLQTEPRPSARPFILVGIITALFGYPIAVGWMSKAFDGSGLLACFVGTIVFLVTIIAYRQIFFPSIFGKERASFTSELRAVRTAQAETRTEVLRDLKHSMNEARPKRAARDKKTR